MLKIYFKCNSCGKHLVAGDATAETKIDCQDCNCKQIVPNPSILQYCSNCNQAVKIDSALQGEVLHCHGCHKPILLPVHRDAKIYCLCKRCEKNIELPVSEAGKLLACPKCEGWIRCPELTEVVNAIPDRIPIRQPAVPHPTSVVIGHTSSNLPDNAQAVLQRLEAEALRLASYQYFFLASFLLHYYDGAYAEETKMARLQLAKRYFDVATQRPIEGAPHFTDGNSGVGFPSEPQ